LLSKEPEDNEENPKRPSKPPVDIKELDPNTNPKSSKKRHSIKLGRSGLNFDAELDTRRSPRHVKALPTETEPDLEDLEEQTPEELASLQQGSDKGKGPKAEVDNLDPPDLIDAPEKIVFFQSMLQKLKEEYGWQIESNIGDVPKKSCRSQHLVGGRPRRYCHTVIIRDKSTIIQLLEIELTSKVKKDRTTEAEALSTLFFRVGDVTATFQRILDELMTAHKDEGLGAMNWKRKFISQNTSVSEYLGHPDNKIKNEQGALDSWMARAAEKVIGM
jgi:hypothetical protein